MSGRLWDRQVVCDHVQWALSRQVQVERRRVESRHDGGMYLVDRSEQFQLRLEEGARQRNLPIVLADVVERLVFDLPGIQEGAGRILTERLLEVLGVFG